MHPRIGNLSGGTSAEVEDALQRGENPNEILPREGVCAMHLAAGLRDKATLILMLLYGGDPNIKAMDGTTPLHVAAAWGCKPVVTALLEHGAATDSQDENGNTPYDLAVEEGMNDCASLLFPKSQVQLSPVLYVADNSQDLNAVNSSNSSSQTVTQRLYKYLEEGTPVYFDATSPDSPCVRLKECHSPHSLKKYYSHLTPKNFLHDSAFTSKPPLCQNEFHSCSSYSQLERCLQNHSQSSSLQNGFCGAFVTKSPCCLHSYRSACQPGYLMECGCSPQNCGNSPCQKTTSCLSASPHSFETGLQSGLFCKSPGKPSCFGSHCVHLNSPSFCHNQINSESCSTSSHIYRTCHQNFESNCNFSPSSHSNSCQKHSFAQPNFHCEKDYDLGKKIVTVEPFVSEDRNKYKSTLVDERTNAITNFDHGDQRTPKKFNVKCTRGKAPMFQPSKSLSVDSSSVKSDTCPGLLKSPYTSTLASSSASSHDKVAAFVLSSADFMSQCNVNDNNANISTGVINADGSYLIDNDSKSSEDQTISDSSTNTFETCSESPCCVQELVKEKEKELHLPDILPKSRIVKAKPPWPLWKRPTKPMAVDLSDIISSDESYLSHRSPRVYRMKSRGPSKVKPSVGVSADDSLFSTVTAKEVVVKDKESGIVFIEKHTPSVDGGSVGRRSLDSHSVSSIATVDSQATLIYDWRTLGKISQRASTGLNFKRSHEPLTELNYANGSQPAGGSVNRSPLNIGLSDSSNDENNPSYPSTEELQGSEIPDHLTKLSCEEISQELRKYGELPGPVIEATRQVYLRRLTTLEANPGLVTLTNKSPDFPPELRQALEGRFDASHLPMLEAKMVEEFGAASQSNKQWREGTEKTSFTYLLLDPRVTENLPLRAKDMTDLEIFKTFICAIFYIGKGKRARPYCHLHEAVRQMNKGNIKDSHKMSQKVRQVIEIWKAGLGVVSLHCFQSVIPVEAYTREACMMEAIGIHKLTNIKRGDFYGVSSTWSMQLRRQIGVYLLKKALQIFLAEGERQICLPDLSS